MWYYLINGQRFGPVEENAMISLINDGTIQMRTFVWKAGMQDWTHAITSEVGDKFFTDTPAVAASLKTIYTPESFYKMWLSIISLDVITMILVFAQASNVPLFTSILSSVLQCVLLYRFWSLIQDGSARTSPGYAVGLCFIPIFHFYWNYVAYVGLAKDMNLYCKQKNISAPFVNETLALVWFLLFLLGHLVLFFPNIWYIGIPSLIITIVLLKQFVDISKEIIISKSK
jgi:hypothetical protein